MSNSHLRWEVVGTVFGRELLLAAFLTEQDALDYIEWMQDEHHGTRCEDNADRVGDSEQWSCRVCGAKVQR